MPDLAGFDLIIEVARGAIERELLNTSLPAGMGGSANDTFVPPFMITRNVPLPGATGLLTLKVTELSLSPQPQTSLTTLKMSFEEGAIEAPGTTVGRLAGQGTVTAPLYFTPPTPRTNSPLPMSDLVLDLSQATSTLQLDQTSSDRLDQAVGVTIGGIIRSSLGTVLTGLFKTQGVVKLPFSFEVDSTRDSTNMMVLAAAPLVRWIDGESLGVFGYHRQGANTGNPAWKINSDLPPAPYPGFPWYPIALLISPSSFQQLVACPAFRSAARDHVSGQHRNAYISEERARNGNNDPATAGEIAAADTRLNQYLDTPAGQAEIAGATPAPCGRGRISQYIEISTPLLDIKASGHLEWLSMDLGEGKVDLKAKGRAVVPCGRVTVEVPMSFQPSIGLDNIIQPGLIQKGEPFTDADFDDPVCEMALGGLRSFLVGPVIGSVFAIVVIAVAESLVESLISEEILKQDLPTPKMSGGPKKLPPNVRFRDLFVAPSGLTIQGVWNGLVIDPHKFNPSVNLYWNFEYTQSPNIFPEPGTFEASCGGEPRTFHYIPHAWDTTLKFTLESSDVPRPLRYDDWWLWHDGVAHKLVPGTLTFPGRVLIPEPPDKETTLEPRNEITIGVQGSNDQGYTLTFRAEDAKVPFQVDTRVIDGTGRIWRLGTNHTKSQGLTFEFDEEYAQFREDCARHIIEVGSQYQLVQDAPIWDQVTTFEHVMQERLRVAVRNQVMGGAAAIRQVMIEQPEIAQQLFRQE